MLKFIETQLIMMNPICPHFAEYCWRTHVYPVYAKAKNVPGKITEQLINMGWPKSDKAFNPILRRKYDYLKSIKSEVNVALEKAKHGGKKSKPGKGDKKEEEVKVIENCLIFVAHEYPEWKKATIEFMQTVEFDANNKPVGNYIKAL